MGCVSSKLVAKEIEQERKDGNGYYSHHVVSLTSSTYGALNLDKQREIQPQQEQQVEEKQSTKECVVPVKKSSPSCEEPSEIINAWELMEGLEEEVQAVGQSKRSPKSRIFDAKSPLKFLNQMGSPRKKKKVGGKENKGRVVNAGMRSWENSPNAVLKESNNLKENAKKPSPRLWASIKGSPNVKRCDSLRFDSGVVLSRRRRSLGPLFDPELLETLEKDVWEEEEEIKKMVLVSSTHASQKGRKSHDSDAAILESYEKKCPPGGENAVIMYTTTLRGIRKTFEECNVARSIIESQNIHMFERDISMHSAFKEELRVLMSSKEVKVPLVFVKGKLIGGADEMVKLEEEGRLGIMFSGIPKAAAGCLGCAGIRFVMCMECNGSCKVLGEDGKKSLKCNKCNENGLIQCPICCLTM